MVYVCMCAHSSYIIPFENRKHDLLSVPSSSFFLGDEKRNCRLRRKEETHTPFFLDEEKEKARGKIVM
jgi:hypothetical protein